MSDYKPKVGEEFAYRPSGAASRETEEKPK